MRTALLTLIGLGLAATVCPPASSQAHPAPECETARCVEREDRDAEEALLWIPRGVLRIPRLVLDASLRLVVLAARANEEYAIVETIDEALFNDARTFGVVPSAFYETGFKPSVGARVIHRDLAGHREGLRMRALFAGIDQQHYTLQLDSGRLLGDVQLRGNASYNRNDSLRFYGLGSAERVDGVRGQPPRSAYERDIAVAARYGSEDARGSLALGKRLSRQLELGGLAQVRRRELSTGDATSIRGVPWVDTVFTRESLVGLGKAATDGYGELVLSWDDRSATRVNLPLDLASTGWTFTGWVGGQTALDGLDGSFARLGGDARHYFDLAHGDRVLVVRLRSSWAIGELRSIPFPDLPSLGGSRLLRGYPAGRFHDRGSLLATVEYRYPVQDNIASYLFVDAGRVLNTLDDALSPRQLSASRVGFGAGIYLFSGGGLLLRAQLASSMDGGLFINLMLDADDDYAQTI